jgi:ABC-type multidrug transport system ATPase subunit
LSVADPDPVVEIEARALVKRYGDRNVVDGFSAEVARGQIFGLLGPNAAGKTTVIRMLCGIIDRDAGEVLINGKDIAGARHRIGYVSQSFGQYEELTVWENLGFYAQMYGVDDSARLRLMLHRYELQNFVDQPAGTLSGGYQRRLALACALAHDPDVLFLDEPTAGIDPVTRKLLWDEFYQLSATGKTLFVTTHYMEEAQRCQQLAFIERGRVIAAGTPDTIRRALGDVAVYAARLAFDPAVHTALLAQPAVLLVNQFGGELRIVVATDFPGTRLAKIITDVTGEPIELLTAELNLEDVFIGLTQHRDDKRC